MFRVKNLRETLEGERLDCRETKTIALPDWLSFLIGESEDLYT